MTTDQLSIEVTNDGSGMLLAVSGEIDYGNVSELRSALIEAARDGTGPVTVDLSSVLFIDSTGLSVLVQGKQRLEETERLMRIANITPRVQRTLELAGMLEYLSR